MNVMRSLTEPHGGEEWFPAELLRCPQCHLVQLGYTADPAVIFPPEYPYRSGTTRILRDNFADLSRKVDAILPLKDKFVVDVGSNDGTLLKNFASAGARVLGVEPSLMAKFAEEDGIPTLMRFFGTEAALEVKKDHGQADIITAANVFAHIPDVNSILESIADLLTPDGIFISESHYFLDLIKTLQYDTIYHEHLRYYSLHSLSFLLKAHGFHVFRAERIPTHGGSIRVYASRSPKYVADASGDALLKEEVEAGLTGTEWVGPFKKRIEQSKLALYELIAPLKREGKSIYAIGAPSRASTLVHYVGIDDGMIDCVLEIQGSKKLDKYMPGTNIPVLDEGKLYSEQPAYALLLSWHIADELIQNLRKKGYKGDFIVPLPEPRIVRGA